VRAQKFRRSAATDFSHFLPQRHGRIRIEAGARHQFQTDSICLCFLLASAASILCYWFVASVKNRLRLDDTLDVFGIHGIAGILGSVGTAVVAAPGLGGHGGPDFAVAAQLLIQVEAVAIAILWSAAGSALCFWVVRRAIGLRVSRDEEREGLDIADHGERAYNH
jgi:Amt family ammonium transporter